MQFYGASFMHSYKQSGQCNSDINVKRVHFVGSYVICVSKCTVQKKRKIFLLCVLL